MTYFSLISMGFRSGFIWETGSNQNRQSEAENDTTGISINSPFNEISVLNQKV